MKRIPRNCDGALTIDCQFSTLPWEHAAIGYVSIQTRAFAGEPTARRDVDFTLSAQLTCRSVAASLGRYEEAAAACEQALRYKPDFNVARNNLPYARSRLGRQRLQSATAAPNPHHCNQELSPLVDKPAPL